VPPFQDGNGGAYIIYPDGIDSSILGYIGVGPGIRDDTAEIAARSCLGHHIVIGVIYFIKRYGRTKQSLVSLNYIKNPCKSKLFKRKVDTLAIHIVSKQVSANLLLSEHYGCY
jgi:hypothetical protein